MNAVVTPTATQDYRVADLGLADWGRKEMVIAESEMPGLMAVRQEFGQDKPLRGARIAGSLHMTIQTAMLIDTLKALGADVRWASCNIFSTQDHAAAYVAATGTPVFAYKGESLEEYWEFTHRIFEWPNGQLANMILDDGGDATLLLMLGARAEQDASVIAKPTNEEETSLYAAIRKRLETSPGWYSKRLAQIQGVTEETTTGVKRLYEFAQERPAALPCDQRQRLGHEIQVRQPVRLPRVAGRRDQARDRRHDRGQGRRRGRLWRRRQGLGGIAACALGAGLDHRDRPDLRAAGRDGRLPGRHDGRGLRQGRHLRDRDRQRERDHPRAHEAHEEPGDRVQHRPLRQRDRDRVAASSTGGRTSSRRSIT